MPGARRAVQRERDAPRERVHRAHRCVRRKNVLYGVVSFLVRCRRSFFWNGTERERERARSSLRSPSPPPPQTSCPRWSTEKRTSSRRRWTSTRRSSSRRRARASSEARETSRRVLLSFAPVPVRPRSRCELHPQGLSLPAHASLRQGRVPRRFRCRHTARDAFQLRF